MKKLKTGFGWLKWQALSDEEREKITAERKEKKKEKRKEKRKNKKNKKTTTAAPPVVPEAEN